MYNVFIAPVILKLDMLTMKYEILLFHSFLMKKNLFSKSFGLLQWSIILLWTWMILNKISWRWVKYITHHTCMIIYKIINMTISRILRKKTTQKKIIILMMILLALTIVDIVYIFFLKRRWLAPFQLFYWLVSHIVIVVSSLTGVYRVESYFLLIIIMILWWWWASLSLWFSQKLEIIMTSVLS